MHDATFNHNHVGLNLARMLHWAQDPMQNPGNSHDFQQGVPACQSIPSHMSSTLSRWMNFLPCLDHLGQRLTFKLCIAFANPCLVGCLGRFEPLSCLKCCLGCLKLIQIEACNPTHVLPASCTTKMYECPQLRGIIRSSQQAYPLLR